MPAAQYEQIVAAETDDHEPAGQLAHIYGFTEYCPAVQLVQELADVPTQVPLTPAAPETVPLGHAMQLAVVFNPVMLEYVPAGHETQLPLVDEATCVEYVPTGQFRQVDDDVAPETDDHDPATQTVHDVELADDQ